jgi:diacylglycerol O-acyltransferase
MLRLSGVDAAFLALETPENHMHVMATFVFDPAATEAGFTVETVRDLVADRLDILPPFRRRIVQVPFQLDHPIWIEDPDFDLEYHVRRAGVSAPGGWAELAELTAEIAGRPLDRTRPLWELWVVDGLEQGHVAMIAKVHHACIDGVSGVELMAALFDLEPDPAPRDAEDAWEPDRVPTELELLLGSIPSIATRPGLAVRAVGNVTRSALKVGQRIRDGQATAGVPFAAPRTSLNGPITPHRKVAFASIPLDDVKRVKNVFGVTVNDVVLAVCAGALRSFLEAGDELPDRPLVAALPTSVRSEDHRGTMGNQLSAMFTELPTQLADPVERLHAVRSVTNGAKQIHDEIGGSTIHDWAEIAAPQLFSQGIRFYRQFAAQFPMHNVMVSNVPGPPFTVYCAGARLVSLYPMGPIFHSAALNITVMSYLGSVGFGLLACRETVPGVHVIAGYVPEAFAELLAAADELDAAPGG